MGDSRKGDQNTMSNNQHVCYVCKQQFEHFETSKPENHDCNRPEVSLDEF